MGFGCGEIDFSKIDQAKLDIGKPLFVIGYWHLEQKSGAAYLQLALVKPIADSTVTPVDLPEVFRLPEMK